PDLARARHALQRLGATGPDVDHQTDTYFRVPHGRLKLREGTVERALIHYARPDAAGPRRSDVTLYPTGPDAGALKAALAAALGVRGVVKKVREIYWADNVKLHLDRVEGLGTFVEAEAIARDGDTEEALRAQCERVLDALGVAPNDLVAGSYVDLLSA
ncbi:MAG: CYTH domain-containing protein, partial [Rhodothermales bacterium]|nr:CYTH domain-containing protein [Rhodothermales bacterium]